MDVCNMEQYSFIVVTKNPPERIWTNEARRSKSPCSITPVECRRWCLHWEFAEAKYWRYMPFIRDIDIELRCFHRCKSIYEVLSGSLIWLFFSVSIRFLVGCHFWISSKCEIFIYIALFYDQFLRILVAHKHDLYSFFSIDVCFYEINCRITHIIKRFDW